MCKRKRYRSIIEPDPHHPLSWDNPANEEAWLALARAIGRQIARDQRDGLIGKIKEEDELDTITKSHRGNTRPHFRRRRPNT
jgi:hypothetical protein